MIRKAKDLQDSLRGEIICDNFEILRFGQLHGSQPEKVFAHVRFRNANFGLDTEVEIPLSAVRSSELKKYIPEAFFLADVPMDHQHKEIAKRLNQELCHAIPFTLLPQGFNHIADQWFYVIGDCIIGNAQHHFYPHNPLNLRINDRAEHKPIWIDWLKTYVKQGPDKAALLLCALSAFILPVTERLSLPSNAVNAYCVGTSGVGKTSFARLVSSVLGNQLPGINLASDSHSIYSTLQHYVDLPCLIDDLNLTASTRERDGKEKQLSELISAAESGGALISKNVPVDIRRTSLICTAEYELPNPSTINRCVLIHFKSTANLEALTYLQTNALHYQFMIIDFVGWICQNYERLSETVAHHLESGEFDYREAHGDPDEYYGYNRIVNNCKLLLITASLLIDFYRNRTLKRGEKLYRDLTTGIKKATAETLNAVKRSKSMSDILTAIARIFAYDPDNIVAESMGKHLEGKLFIRWKNHIYFSGESVAIYLSGRLDHEITLKTLSCELSKENLLVLCGKEKTAPLPKDLKKILKSSGRHYKLSVPALCDLVLGTHSRFETMYSPLEELRPNTEDKRSRYKKGEEDYISISW